MVWLKNWKLNDCMNFGCQATKKQLFSQLMDKVVDNNQFLFHYFKQTLDAFSSMTGSYHINEILDEKMKMFIERNEFLFSKFSNDFSSFPFKEIMQMLDDGRNANANLSNSFGSLQNAVDNISKFNSDNASSVILKLDSFFQISS
jgi:hypothetical protein